MGPQGRRSATMTSLTLALLIAFAPLLGADDGTPSGTGPAGLLAGPAVAPAEPARRSIIERGFDGVLVPLDDEPEVVAALAVAKDDVQRARLESVAAARTKAFEEILFEHSTTIVGLGEAMRSAKESGTKGATAAFAKLREVNGILAPFRARGDFIDECGSALDPAEAAEARRLAAEWRAARAAELPTVEGADAMAAPAGNARAEARMRMEELGAMVKRSIQRRAASRTAQFEHLVKELDLTPEQAERVRSLFMEIAVQEIQGTRERGTYTRREQQQVFGELAKILDERQRRKLGEMITGMPAGAP